MIPAFGRRGFRDWDEMLADLAAIGAAPAPSNHVHVAGVDAAMRGGVSTGALVAEASSSHVALLIDGAEVARLERGAFRGAWLSMHEDRYTLDIDVGVREPIQVSGPGEPRPMSRG